MALSKLWQLLNTLSPEELGRFRDFLYSPYHNRSIKVRQLFDEVHLSFPIPLAETPEKTALREETLDHQRLFTALFPKKAPGASNLSNLMTTLKGLLEEFLAYERFALDKRVKVSLLLEDLCYREGAESFFGDQWKKAQKLSVKEEGSSLDLLVHQLKLEDLWMTHAVITGDRGQALNVEQTLDSLLKYTLAAHLRYGLAALNRSQLEGTPFEVPFLSQILDYVLAHAQHLQIPVIAIYYQLVKCFQEPADVKHYAAFQSAMHAHADGISAEEAAGIYPAIINYLIGRWRKGEDRLGEIFAWYKEAETHGALAPDGAIQPGNYLNVVNVGLALANAAKGPAQKTEIRAWVEAFAKRNHPLVKPALREGVYQQAQAFLAYDIQAYSEAAKHLQAARSDLMTEIGRRVLLLKVYFDMEDAELFAALLNASLLFLHRKKSQLALHKFQAYNQFFRLCDKLFSLFHQPKAPPKKWLSLRDHIQHAEALESRQWLLKRIRREE